MAIAIGLIGFTTALAATNYFSVINYNCSSTTESENFQDQMCNMPRVGQNNCGKKWQHSGKNSEQNAQIHNMRQPEGKVVNCWIRGIQKQLGLNDTQSTQIEKLQQKHLTFITTEWQELTTLKSDLRIESLKIHSDREKIDRLSEKIGKQQATLARMKSRHLEEVASILTPAQRDKMQKLIHNRTKHNNCSMMCQ